MGEEYSVIGIPVHTLTESSSHTQVTTTLEVRSSSHCWDCWHHGDSSPLPQANNIFPKGSRADSEGRLPHSILEIYQGTGIGAPRHCAPVSLLANHSFLFPLSPSPPLPLSPSLPLSLFFSTLPSCNLSLLYSSAMATTSTTQTAQQLPTLSATQPPTAVSQSTPTITTVNPLKRSSQGRLPSSSDQNDVMNMTPASVEDHFAKALGEKWSQLQNNGLQSQTVTTAHRL